MRDGRDGSGRTAGRERCFACGGLFEAADGPVHAYMASTPGCWAAFGRVLAAEYADPSLLPTHRLSVDAYAVQHPGDDSRRAVQSVGLHLARLHVQLERRLDPVGANAFMLRAGRLKAGLPRLTPPSRFPVTAADVVPVAGTAGHEAAVLAWARSAWDAWSHAHDFVRAFAASVPETSPPDRRPPAVGAPSSGRGP